VTRDNAAVTVSGDGWTYRLDTTTGTLSSMSVDGRELLRAGPRLDLYRPPTSNENYLWWWPIEREEGHKLGLDRLATTVTGVTTGTEADTAVVEVHSTAAAPGLADRLAFDQTMRFRVDARGTITLDHQVAGRGSGLTKLRYLPRVGVSLQVPDSMNRFAWYGKGPHENYNDRKRSARTGVWRSTVDDQYVRYSRPQAYGNHTDTRWATLSDGRHAGILVGGNLNVSVTPYDDLDRAEYDFQLPLVRNPGWVTLHAAAGETGVGDTPNSTQEQFQVSPAGPHRYELVLRPLTEGEVRAGGVPG
jgi:beta-galactosidase